eukprot:SAG11_NODE_1007_length_6206_cov_36.144752_5_plen_23_part_01
MVVWVVSGPGSLIVGAVLRRDGS